MKLAAVPTGRTGQHALLKLRFEERGGRTVLAGRYSEAPFGAVRASYADASGAAELQVTNPSGGILGGDGLRMEVSLAPGTSAAVLTQAANKAYGGPEARQDSLFEVGEGAVLEYLPHHLIPYASSNYRQTTEVNLAGSATLVTWDAYSAGRIARGERFAYTRLSSRTRITRDGAPVAVDGFDLAPGGEPFGGCSYLAGLYVLSPVDLSPLAEKLHAVLLRGTPRILASASAPSSGLCAVRVLARDATVLYRALNACRAASRAYLGLAPPSREVW